MQKICLKLFFNLGKEFRKRCCLKILLRPFCSAEQNHLYIFGKGSCEEHFCEIILDLDQWFCKRDRKNIFLIYSSGGPSVRCSKTI